MSSVGSVRASSPLTHKSLHRAAVAAAAAAHPSFDSLVAATAALTRYARGAGSPGAWKDCLKAYGLTEQQALEYRGNPLDQLQPLAKAKVPLLHVVGEADQVVPVDENTDVLAQRYRQLGGSIEVIRKPGVGHHPHSLKDPAPIVAFILKHS